MSHPCDSGLCEYCQTTMHCCECWNCKIPCQVKTVTVDGKEYTAKDVKALLDELAKWQEPCTNG